MIAVEGLQFRYPPVLPGGGPAEVLDGVSFDVPEGRCTAITGASGSGTTTLLMAVAGLAPRLTGGTLSGRMVIGGRDVQAEPPGALADLMGVCLEDPAGQLFNPSVADEVAWGLENLGVPPEEMPARIARALAMVHLDDVPLDQAPQTLSGGQQRRLALAAALALEPRVLILDHPSGGLSPLGRAEMIAALRGLRESGSLTILFAENDPAVIAALADDVLILEDGKIALRGKPAEVYPALDRRRFPGISVPPAGLFAHEVNARRNGSATGLTCLTLEQALAQVRGTRLKGRGVASQAPHPQDTTSAETAIAIEHLSFAYQPDQFILRDLSLTIPRGQFVAITGDNGAGKTTLARHLIGLLRPTEGSVSISGEDIAGKKISRIAREVGYAFQNPEMQIFNPTLREEVGFGAKNLGVTGDRLAGDVEKAMADFGLAALADFPPAMLSFSGRRMVALAGVAAMGAPVLVLDEPTVGLDAEGGARVEAWLAARHKSGATIVLVTHDMELVARLAERVIVMRGGKITADGPPHEVFGQVGLLAEAGLEPPFATGFAAGLGRPELAGDLTPEGAARAWLGQIV